MKKNLLLMMLCCPMMLAAQQTNGVTVSGLAVDAGTVTFNVSWKTPMPVALWSDTVWVFVDYNNNGTMERLPVTGATASAGTVIKIPGNDKGVWIAGNARSTGSFSATVKLLTTVKNVGGACVYASNYPPVGKYTAADKIEFTGTPPYNIVLKNAGGSTETRTESSPYTVPTGYTVQSFMDKTGAPGTFTCVPSTVYDLKASAAGFCAGGTGVTFALSGTDDGQYYELYRNGTMIGTTLEGTGSAATFSGSFEAGTYSAQTVPGSAFCPAEMTGSHEVSENPLPSDLSLTANLTTICHGQSATLTASATSGVSYSIDNSIWQTTKEFNVPLTSNQSYTLYVKTSAGCSAMKANAAAVAVNPVPATPSGASTNSRCASGMVIFSVTTVPTGCTIDWYTESGGGSTVSDGYGTASFSPTLSTSTTYYAQSRDYTTGCVSTSRLSVTGTVNPVPTITCVNGASSQNVYRNAPIANIVYTASDAATISMTGSFPTGVDGYAVGSSYTISGTPTIIGTFNYSLTAVVGGCTRTVAGGTVKVVCETNVTPGSVPVTLCTKCCYNGSAWVDCNVTTYAYPFDNPCVDTQVSWMGGDATYYSDACSDKNGRTNTAAITGSKGTSAVQICKNLGAGWYLPAYEELVNMSSGYQYSPLNGLAGADLLSPSWHWSSSEFYHNGGRSTTSQWYSDRAVLCAPNGYISWVFKTDSLGTRCAILT
jgi:hypothetical protein